MDFTIREAVLEDWQEAGRICYEAFKTVSEEHGFPPDFPSVEAAALPLKWMIEHPQFYSAVAVRNGQVIGSIFMDERSRISAIGPITVDCDAQNVGVGRALMKAAMDHANARGAISIRLLQLAFHNRSLSLYAKLGFDIRGAYGAMYGKPLARRLPGYDVRMAMPDDEAACNALSVRVHGHERPGEVREAIAVGEARVVERLGRITAYTTGINYFAHTVAETSDDIKALICEAKDYGTPGFLVPLRDSNLFQWCLGEGLKVWFVLNMMTTGIYQEPEGAHMPSIGY